MSVPHVWSRQNWEHRKLQRPTTSWAILPTTSTLESKPETLNAELVIYCRLRKRPWQPGCSATWMLWWKGLRLSETHLRRRLRRKRGRPCSMFSISRLPRPQTLHSAPCTLHPAPYTLHPTPCTLYSTTSSNDFSPGTNCVILGMKSQNFLVFPAPVPSVPLTGLFLFRAVLEELPVTHILQTDGLGVQD
jgi:hypothetical protein